MTATIFLFILYSIVIYLFYRPEFSNNAKSVKVYLILYYVDIYQNCKPKTDVSTI